MKSLRPMLLVLVVLSPECLKRLVSALCPVRCQCNDDRLVVLCNNSALDLVPITLNPELKELYLSNNQIKSIFSSFAVYRDLELLDMTHNSITTLGRKNFELQKNLKVMLIGHNLISEINNMTFHGLNSLVVLKINDNVLEELPRRVFQGLNRLETLDLSSNAIQSLSPESFSGLINLRSLALRDNRLSGVPAQSLSHLPNLIKLDIGRNSLREIPEFAFSPLTSLEELLLDSCALQSVPTMALQHLTHLRRLNLQDNLLKDIPTEALEHVKNVEELILSKNRVESIRAFAFRGMTNLRRLDVSSIRQLRSLDRDAFLENPRLDKLVLEFNENLRHLLIGTFDANSANLKYVSLRGNGIETLHPRLLQWERLHFFDIRQNPLNCNCSLVWLWQYLKRTNFSGQAYSDSVVCAAPPNLMAHPLLSIPVSELGCYESKNPELITGTIVVVVIICSICCIFLAIACRNKLAFFINKKKYDPALYPALAEDMNYEKGRIIDNQIMCSPTTAIIIKPPYRIAPITEL